MRKSLILMLIATLLVGAMLVSCNSDAAGNSSAGEKLAKVVISGENESKGISAVANDASGVDQTYWFYMARKNDSSVYRTGDTNGTWKPVKTQNSAHVTGLVDADLGYFSEGEWLFSFRAYSSSNVTPSLSDTTAVYFATNVAVDAIETNLNNGVIKVAVTLQGGSGLADALVSFRDINWKYASDNQADCTLTLGNLNGKTATVNVYRKPTTDSQWTLFATDTATIADGEAAFNSFTSESSSEIINVPSSIAGTEYNVKFEVTVPYNNENVIIGTYELQTPVKAYKGGTIVFSRTTNQDVAIDDNESQFKITVTSVEPYSGN